MSLASFSKPSDVDVLLKIVNEDNVVSFVGKGSILQNVKETLYIRTVKIELDKKEDFKKVIYVKRGIKWLFKTVETITSFNNPTFEIEKMVS